LRVLLADLGGQALRADLAADVVEDGQAGIGRIVGADLAVSVERGLQVQVDGLFLVVDGGRLDVALIDLGQRLGRLHRLVVAAAGDHLGDQEDEDEADGNPQQWRAG